MSEVSPKDAMKTAAAAARQQFEARPRPIRGGSYVRTKDSGIELVPMAAEASPASDAATETPGKPVRKGKE